MRPLLPGAVLALVLAATAACGEETTPPDPPPGGTETATATPSIAEPSPTTTAPAPTATPEPPRDLLPSGPPQGELAVYATGVGPPPASGLGPMEVRAYDLGAGRLWASFRYEGTEGDGLVDVQPGPRRSVVLATEHHVELHSLETGETRELYRAADGMVISGLATSRTREMVVVTTRAYEFPDAFSNGAALVFDISGGASREPTAIRAFDRTDPHLAGFYGWFAFPEWLAGDAGVAVIGALPKDGPGARATLFMDGSVAVYPDVRTLSPDGTKVFVSPTLPCPFIPFGPSRLEIRDAVSNEILAQIADAEYHFFAAAWAPDSSAVLYQEWPTGSSPDCETPSDEPWGLLPADGGPTSGVDDGATLEAAWATVSDLAVACPGRPPLPILPGVFPSTGCFGSPLTILVRGQVIDHGYQHLEPLGLSD